MTQVATYTMETFILEGPKLARMRRHRNDPETHTAELYTTED